MVYKLDKGFAIKGTSKDKKQQGVQSPINDMYKKGINTKDYYYEVYKHTNLMWM